MRRSCWSFARRRSKAFIDMTPQELIAEWPHMTLQERAKILSWARILYGGPEVIEKMAEEQRNRPPSSPYEAWYRRQPLLADTQFVAVRPDAEVLEQMELDEHPTSLLALMRTKD
jgi:hypothetical protein